MAKNYKNFNATLKPKISLLNKDGFTLIELLVVIAIIGVLSSVVLASLNTARAKARDSKRISDIKQLQIALELYYDENGKYPISNWLSSNQEAWKNSTNILATSLKPYLSRLPLDPINNFSPYWPFQGGSSYAYYANYYGGTGDWYMLILKLENQNSNLDLQDGVTTPDGTRFDYGGNDGYIITLGVSN